ncbi:MAG: nickel-dependent lactate racemase [Thermoplasmata archaeon]
MRIEVPYGEGREIVEVPEGNLGEVVYQRDVVAPDEVQVVLDAVSRPVGSEPLDRFLEGGENILVIVNDATRPTPSWRILKAIWSYLEGKNVRYLVATGMHQVPTEDEYKLIFGELYESIKARVFAHNSKNSEMVDLGYTKLGTHVMINKMVMDADRIIVISSVEPHYFAGYTGGRKSFLPGVAAYETIEQNHKHALKIEAQSLRLEGNPVSDDMEDAMKFLKHKEIFSIMVVLDKNHRTCCAYAGDLKDSWLRAVRMADEIFVIDLKYRADIVVAVTAFPYDIDLYQSQKALDNAKYAVKDGGIIILVSACRKGVGPPTFLNLLGSASSPKEVLDKIALGYKLGYHKAAKMAEIGLKCKMFAVTKLDPDTAKKAHLTPVNSLQEAIDMSIRQLGPGAKVTFIMDAVITVPRVQQ